MPGSFLPLDGLPKMPTSLSLLTFLLTYYWKDTFRLAGLLIGN